ncbi:hypothetical protein CTAYLR_004886 [Chrysophaeum taylorii]|uniref:Phospholipid scramblase n=1 Tax=Chrysophaeum taylorii TaxID=2483200 RepID=A0AAD7UGN2_9STRA|nr:hypothetical protein CTAYLR_004886 [Chrysophaeum taylorii]
MGAPPAYEMGPPQEPTGYVVGIVDQPQAQVVSVEVPVVAQQPVVVQPAMTQAVVVVQPMGVAPQEVSGTAGVNARLGSYAYIKVVQKFSWLEAASQGLCEIPNVYNVYGGSEFSSSDAHILIAEEKSSGCTRTFCAPHHSTLLLLRDAQTRDILATLERPGAECCFDGNCFGPKPCLCCFACSEGCADQLIVHEGAVEGRPGQMVPGVAIIRQPENGGGGCTPTLYIETQYQREGTIRGPCVFGGCSELCFDTIFRYYEHADGAEIGRIQHVHPECCTGDCFAEMCTDSDRFGIEMTPAFKGDDRAKALAALLLIDYMFFEMDNGMFTVKPATGRNQGCTIYVTFFQCYCYGCICPCRIVLPCESNDNND